MTDAPRTPVPPAGSRFRRRVRAILLSSVSLPAITNFQRARHWLSRKWGMAVVPRPEIESARFFDEHYRVVANHHLRVGEKLELADPVVGVCRFCDRQAPEATFRKEAHALPHALGNKTLTTSFECDDCNEGFGETIENDLGAWTLPLRWLAQIRGNGGLPKLKKGSSGGWRFDFDERGQRISQQVGDRVVEVDEAKRLAHLKLRRDPYHPVGVYKALVKIALTIMPYAELGNFADTIGWIRERDHSRSITQPLTVLRTFVPGPRPFDEIQLWLMLRRDVDAALPYAIFVIAFGNDMLQLVVPSRSQDAAIAGNPLSLRFFPNQYEAGRGLAHAGFERTSIDLSNPGRIKGDIVTATFSFERARRTDADGSIRLIG